MATNNDSLNRFGLLIMGFLLGAITMWIFLLVTDRLQVQDVYGSEVQEVCPEGDGWDKIDDLDGFEYTYTTEENCKVVESCYKHATYVHYGDSATVEADTHEVCRDEDRCKDKRYELSHASFRVKCEEPEPTLTPTPTPEVCETEKWSCDACQNDPNKYEERLGVCYKPFIEYCGESYGCDWVSNCPDLSDTFTSKIQECTREWVCEDTCEVPEPTPTPEVTPTPDPTPTPTDEPEEKKSWAKTEPAEAPVCEDSTPGGVANIYVDRGTPNDSCLEIRWLNDEPVADNAHIMYTDGNPGDWRFALLDTENDGVEEICGLQNGTHYWFTVAQVNGCAVGAWSDAYDPLP